MESPTPVSCYIHQNSKKGMYPGGSSSSLSNTCKDVEVLEVSPPSNICSATPRPSKNKEVLYHEIIDVDIEEDSDVITLTDLVPKTSRKGKEILQDPSAGNNSLANDGPPDNIMSNTGGSHDLVNEDDFGSGLLEDEWADTYHDDMLYDDYSVLESQFDHMDIPTGVEVPFPWFPGSPSNNTKVPETSSSILSTSKSGKRRGVQKNTDSLGKKVKKEEKEYNPGHKMANTSGTSLGLQASLDLFSNGSAKQSSHSKNERNYRSVNSLYSSHLNYPSGTMSANGGGYSTLNVPTTAAGGFPNPMLGPAFTHQGFPHDGAFRSAVDHVNNQSCASSAGASIPTSAESKNVDEILQKYASFKKFDTVEDISDHHYRGNSSSKHPPKNWARKIQDEWRILEKDLPAEIFVRVYESRMDLLRAVIIGAEGTPYHDGLYFFDVFFPNSYPNVPPHVYYHSGGLRINPNLYNCGKVCLSLLNTWSGSQKEKWIPGVSTILQVLVSIQGLILNAKPYFNEPGYANSSGTVTGEKKSVDYNETTYIYSLQTMVYNMRRPPKHFEDFVAGHFCKYARDILVSCKAYLDGAQVGCLVKGGVQDVDEGDKSCSKQFRAKLSGFMSVLVNAFSQVGARDCELTLDGNGKAPAPRHRGARDLKIHVCE